LNFISGDKRVKQAVAIKKALSVILYTMSKASFTFLGKLFNCSPTQPYNWVREAGIELEEPEIRSDIKEISIDEMWHFIKKKLKNAGFSKQWTVTQAELLPGLQVVVMLQQSKDSTTN
jgi:hypothetical protein